MFDWMVILVWISDVVVIVDVDIGYGGLFNVYYMVCGYEEVGVVVI